jgi:hypothetical protein
MNPWFVFFLLFGAAALAGVGFATALLWPTIAIHFDGVPGRWNALAQIYGCKAPAPADCLHRQSLAVGGVLYRNCVSLSATDAGLYLRLGFPLSILRRPALLIPWTTFERLEEARLFRREAALLWLGEPTGATLTLPMSLLEKIQDHLPLESIDARED